MCPHKQRPMLAESEPESLGWKDDCFDQKGISYAFRPSNNGERLMISITNYQLNKKQIHEELH